MSDLDQIRALMNTTLWIFTGLSFFLLALVIGLMVALDRATGQIRAAAGALAMAKAEHGENDSDLPFYLAHFGLTQSG